MSLAEELPHEDVFPAVGPSGDWVIILEQDRVERRTQIRGRRTGTSASGKQLLYIHVEIRCQCTHALRWADRTKVCSLAVAAAQSGGPRVSREGSRSQTLQDAQSKRSRRLQRRSCCARRTMAAAKEISRSGRFVISGCRFSPQRGTKTRQSRFFSAEELVFVFCFPAGFGQTKNKHSGARWLGPLQTLCTGSLPDAYVG